MIFVTGSLIIFKVIQFNAINFFCYLRHFHLNFKFNLRGKVSVILSIRCLFVDVNTYSITINNISMLLNDFNYSVIQCDKFNHLQVIYLYC